MGKKIDLTNQRFGKLLVLKEGGRDSSNKILWICQCDCGNIKEIRGNDLRSGKIVSCGCYGKQQRVIGKQKYLKNKEVGFRNDLTNKKFGRLLVLSFNKEETINQRKKRNNFSTWWECQCDCGKIINVEGSALASGHTKSCGCLQKELAAQTMKQITQPAGVAARFVDLTNQRFGKLVVLKRYLENTQQNKPRWFCKCDCGNFIIVNGESLKHGYTQSCGCIGPSLGQNKIRQILLDNHIIFQQEVKFEDLKDQSYLRFDFGIYDTNQNLIKLIEYDGRQHTDETSIWHNETLLKHDLMKDEYCKKNNIKLQRISYLDFDKINLEYLLT